METIHINDILPPARNYRSRIDQERLESLADSIRDRGILQNLLVVRAEERLGSPKYRVVAGERRYRAVQIAIERVMEAGRLESGGFDVIARGIIEMLEQIPVKILTDAEAAEAEFLQLVENLQREEVPLVDEIRVIHSWVADRGLEVTDIAAKLGVDREWVRRRNQLALCPPQMMRALEEGRVTMKTALLVCAVPDEARRLEFAGRVLNPVASVTPLDERQTRAMLESDYLLPLKDVPWPTALETAGLAPCVGCQHRREMKAGPMCLMASCYGAKARHAFAMQCEERGLEALDDAAAWRIFSGPLGRVDPSADWLDLAEEVPAREVGHYGGVKWRKWIEEELGEKVEAVARVYLALHPSSYQVRELVAKAAVRMLLKAAAKQTGPDEDKSESAPEDEAAEDGEPVEAGAEETAEEVWESALDTDDLEIYQGLYTRVIEAEQANRVPLDHPDFVRRILGALLMRMRPAEVRQWAHVCGIPLDGDGAFTAVHEVRQVHPRLLSGLLTVACVVGRPQDASSAQAELPA